ncbi:MAG: hypothetical protein JSS60_03085 [Verrucomicrobia bacterium]|nr:hypothetical protein [Verrucomicrobiota bacterium]
MSGTRTPHPSSDNFWSSSSKFVTSSLPISAKKRQEAVSDLLSAVDESPEFYDPYSDLNLFLSQKIKQEMQHCGSSKKWSVKIQEELLVKIAPDFQKRFPQFRLGVSALRKTWEKVAYYSQQIQNQKEAITQDGKLNIHFFIKENLKNYTSFRNPGHLHPSHYAHQLATKMSECIATIDGVRPQLDHLTKMIWSIQRHLLTGGGLEQYNSPYDEYDQIDKLIVKTILEMTAKYPQIGYSELEHKVKEVLHSLHELPSFSSLDHMMGSVSALIAEKLYNTSALHSLFFSEQKTAITNFIRRHSSLCKTAAFLPQLSEFVRRIIALYALASGLPKTLQEDQVKEAVLSIYPQSASSRPELPQALYAFISAELVLMKSEEYCRSPSYVADAIWTAYKEATLLPLLQGKGNDLLEIAIWKSLSETEGLLEKLPYRIGQRIEEEVANILIENPTQSFSSLVQETVSFFKRTKELVQIKEWSEIEKKIHIWSVQGDMLCRWIRLNSESTLLRLICQKWKDHPSVLPHHTFVSEICQQYLKSYPELAPYSAQLSLRVWILYKYAWYSLLGAETESSFDRFLKWHSCSLLFSGATLDHEHLVHQLEEIVHKTLPLTPFDRKQADAALAY